MISVSSVVFATLLIVSFVFALFQMMERNWVGSYGWLIIMLLSFMVLVFTAE